MQDNKSIKKESVLAVFRTICGKDGISRADIARITQLSIMTVGKICDSLFKLGIITENKEQVNGLGRKAGLSRVSDVFFVLVLRGDKLTAIDTSLSLICEYSGSGKELCDFITGNMDMSKCVGIGLLDGERNKENDGSSDVEISGFTYEINKYASSHYMASLSAAALSGDGFLHVGETLYGAYRASNALFKINAKNVLISGKPLCEYIQTDGFIPALAETVDNIAYITGIRRMFIEADKSLKIDIGEINGKLKSGIEVVGCGSDAVGGISEAYAGMAKILREYWMLKKFYE